MNSGRKLVIWVLFAALVGMFATSLYYRIVYPDLRVESQQAPAGMGQGQAPAGMGEGQAAMIEQMGRIRELLAAEEAGQADRDTLLELAEAFMMMQAADRSLVYADKVLDLAPGDVDALRIRGVSLYQLDRYQESAEAFEAVLAEHPDDEMARINLGIVYKHALDQPERAAEHFQALIDSPTASEGIKARAAQELGR